MIYSLKKLGLFSSIVLTSALSSASYAATLTVVTKYGDSGGNAGKLNKVGDKVNGNDICPVINDYNNATAGCDMSADPGYNDSGTPLDTSDDFPEGDLIVRTNDIFNVSVAFGWLGNAGGTEEQVTLTGTLPAGKGFIWEGIPGSCDQAASSLSNDKKTIACVKKDFDANDTGSYAEDMAFSVRVEGDAANNSIPGDVSFTVTDPTNSTPATDGVEDGNSANLLKITAAPRWNIDKHAGPGYYTTSYGVKDDQGNPGWYLWYQFSIEVDEVDGTDDDAPGRLGNEALQGGTNATVSFVDDISNISPNAKLVTWDSNGNFSPASNACDMDTYTNSDEPYPSYNASYPDRSIQLPTGSMGVTCEPASAGSQSINVTVTGIDGTLTSAPIKNRSGGLLPVNRAIAAIGLMRIFVPLSDVQAGADGVANTADDGSLNTQNCITDFNPIGISGGSNFGNNAAESEVDNCRNITLHARGGSWSKDFRKGWSDQSTEVAKWGGGGWWLAPTDASYVRAGDGTITPGGKFGTYTVYSNTGGESIENPVLCDVIDVETYDMTIIDSNADNPGTLLDDTKHAVDLNYSTTESIPGIAIQYATGYVGNWPPNPNEAPSTGTDEVVNECSDPNIVWYPDYVTAAANGPVSKVRISAPSLPSGKLMAMRIKHTARSTYLSTKNGHIAGAPIKNDEILINHASYKSSLTNDNYRAGSYSPKDSAQNPSGSGGDRLIMVRAKARIIKAMSPAAVSPGSDVTVTLTPSFTTDGPLPETENVTIKDLLPKGLTYTNGSTTGSYGDLASPTEFSEPLIISPVTDADCTTHAQDLIDKGYPCASFNNGTGDESILIWDLGNQVTGTVFRDLVFHTIVDVDAPTGILANYALIESPADSSKPSKRVSNANVNDTVPSSLLIVKSVQTPLHEINANPLLNWMKFRVGLRNGSSNTLNNLDVIDIIPFNADGNPASFTFTPQVGTTVHRTRVPATSFHGSFEFDDVSIDDNGGQCTGTPTYWFTKSTNPIDVSALHPSNDVTNGSTNWCGGDTTVAASIATCGFTKSEVTAVRVRGSDMTPSGTCFVNLTFATSGNLDNDIYSNTAGAQALGVTSAVLSNTVSARVYASSIGSKVWLDADADGIQDANEDGIPGVIVKLLDNNGNPVKDPANLANDYQVVTDAFGNYLFENLKSGDYQVKFELDSAVITSKGSGSNTALDSDVNPATGIAAVSIAENQDKTDIDAGITGLGSIGNLVWNDTNHDGIQDANESGVGGILVTLLDGAGSPKLDDSGNLITTTTLANGSYKFSDLLPGNYSVGFSNLPTENVFTVKKQGGDDAKDSDVNAVTGKTEPITLAPGENITTLDAGIYKLEQPPVAVDDSKSGLIPGTVGSINVVTNDTDPENNLDPATVVITSSPVNGATITNNGKTITVPGEGVWNVAADGTVSFTPDANFTNDPTPIKYKVSDEKGKVSNEATITLDYDPLRKISGNVSIDIDNNGTADKAPLSPVTITLYKADGVTVVATTTTDSFGHYSFDVPGGNYIIKETDLSGVTSVSDIDGANDNAIAVDATTADVPSNDFIDKPVLGNVKGIIFIDDDANGLFDGAEAQTISNIDIVVTDAYGIEHNISTSATLNADGKYEYDLTDLPVGPATVSVNTGDPDLPEGATPTTGIIATVAIPADAYAIQNFGFNVPAVVDSDPKTLASCANPSSITWEGSTVSSNSIWHNMNASTDIITAKEFTTAGDSNISVKMYVIDTDNQFNYIDAGTHEVNNVSGYPENGIFGQPYLTLYLGSQNNNIANQQGGGLLATGQEATLHVEFGQSVLLDNWRIRDLDSGDIRSGETGWDWQDAVRMKAFDENDNEVALNVSIGSGTNLKLTNGFYHTDKNITGNPDDVLKGTGTAANSATGHIVYSSAGLPIKRLEITHAAGPDIANQTRSALALSGFAVCTVLEISGKVTNDANGNGDGVTGPTIETANGAPLYAHLVDTSGNVVDVVTIAADGAYLFNKHIDKDTDYTVVLSSDKTNTGSIMATPALPVGWENASEDTGSDANIDGILPVSVASSVITNIDFGLNEVPVASDVAEPSQLNPANAQTVQVTGLSVSDPEDGTPTTVIIKTLPTNGTLFYSGATVTVGQVIPNFDPTLLLLDPNPGNITATFDYQTKDAAGALSNSATVTMPFTYVPPIAADNAKTNPLSGSDTVVDVLTNDTKGSYNFDPATVKIALPGGGRVTSLVVPDQGEWTVNPTTGAITFSPAVGFTDDPTPIQYVVSDISGIETNIVNVTIDYPQTKPKANNDAKSGVTNNPVTVDVLNNDSDLENDLDPTTVKLIDPNSGNPVTSLVVAGEGLWDVDASTGAITFTPEDGFTADPTPVNYTVRDKTGLLSNEATVTIDYEIQPPVADNDKSIGHTPNTSVTINPLDGDSDPDGSLDPNSVKLTGANASADGKTLTVPSEGVWKVNATTGEITFTPETSFTGNPTPVTYTVADNDGNPSNEATVVIEYRDPSSISLLKHVYGSNDQSSGHDSGQSCEVASNRVVILDADEDHNVYVTYCFTVVNTSAGYLTDIKVVDNTLGLTHSSLIPVDAISLSLAPGESISYYIEREQSDDFTNLATVTATPSDVDGTATGENSISSTSIANLIVSQPVIVEDDVHTYTPGKPNTVNILENDGTIEPIDPSTLRFTLEGTPDATLSADGKTLYVAGEGIWTMNGDGSATFTPYDGYMGNPTPPTYIGESYSGLRSNVASIALNANGQAIPTLSEWAILMLIMLLGFVSFRQGAIRKGVKF